MAPPVLTQSSTAIPTTNFNSDSSTETLPASWFSSPAILELEKEQYSTRLGTIVPMLVASNLLVITTHSTLLVSTSLLLNPKLMVL